MRLLIKAERVLRADDAYSNKKYILSNSFDRSQVILAHSRERLLPYLAAFRDR